MHGLKLETPLETAQGKTPVRTAQIISIDTIGQLILFFNVPLYVPNFNNTLKKNELNVTNLLSMTLQNYMSNLTL
jgi:hypothetical protein